MCSEIRGGGVLIAVPQLHDAEGALSASLIVQDQWDTQKRADGQGRFPCRPRGTGPDLVMAAARTLWAARDPTCRPLGFMEVGKRCAWHHRSQTQALPPKPILRQITS